MAGTEYLDHLASIRLFSSCNRKELPKIAKSTDELEVKAGKVLTERGQVRPRGVRHRGGRGHRRGRRPARSPDSGPGAHFGELALLDGGPSTATVKAATDMTLLVISQRAFFSLLDEVPGLARKLLTSMARIIRDLDAKLPDDPLT